MKFQCKFILLIFFFNIRAIKSLYTYHYDDSDEDFTINWDNYDDFHESTSLEIKFENNINLTNIHIPILNADIFEYNENLTNIILKNNSIKLIEVNTFNKFNKTLKHLEITLNNLSTFDIQPIKSLQKLNLSNNSLTILNSTDFQKLKLLELDVSSNNITEIYCLNVSKSINLSHNNISSICNFSKTIEYIDLSYNSIKFIQNYIFKGLIQLKNLDLSHNQIATLQYGTFDISTDKIFILNLKHNMFTEFDLLHFKNIPKLFSLNLSYNNISIVHHHSKMKFRKSYHGVVESSFGIEFCFENFHELLLEGNPIKEINMTNLLEICYNLNVISISFSEISCSMLQNHISEVHFGFVKGPVTNEENINGIKCDSSLNTIRDSDYVAGMLILLHKVSAILIVLAFFFIVFVIFSFIVTVKRFRANINLK